MIRTGRRGRLGFGLILAVLLVSSLSSSTGKGESVPFIRLDLPLPRELPTTASFGEFRPDHFHAGLDFSTRRELGWPVRAAADGEVYRLKVESRGYGRALYLRHAGGFETVYAHLHEFEEERLGLEGLVEKERARTGERFPGDIPVEPPVRIRRGQVIGLSGEKGSGPPHLHLELRYRGAPVDPIRHGGLRPRGFAEPVLDSLWILPRGPCRVNGEWAPVQIRFKGEPEGYGLASTAVVEGDCDLFIQARIPGAGNMGLSRLDVDCGMGRFLRANLDRFSFDQYRQVGLLYEMERSATSGRFLYRLRPGTGLDLPGVVGVGLEAFPPGTVQCTVRAEDPVGRRAEGQFVLEVGPAPPYADDLPEEMKTFRLSERLLLLDGSVALDPLSLPPGAAGLHGMPLLFQADPGESGMDLPGGWSIRFPEGAFFGGGPVALAVGVPVPEPEPGLHPVGPPLRLAPEGLFLRTPARLLFRPPEPEQSSYYRLDPVRGEWTHQGGTPDGEVLEGRIRLGGTYAVFRDDSPPVVTDARIREEKRLRSRRLVFPVEEVGQGVAPDAFHVTLDGEAVEAEFDPDRKWGQVWLSPDVTGRRVVEAWCRDRAGNESERFRATVSF